MSETPFTIRLLGPSDLPLFRAMNELFGAAFDDPGSYLTLPPTDDYVRDLLGKDHFFAIVALSGDDVIGSLAAYALEKFEQARSEIYIYDLAVAENWRRRGVATAMIDHLGKIAAMRGAWVMFVQADYGDDPAIALYDKLGSREEVLHFDIPAGDGER